VAHAKTEEEANALENRDFLAAVWGDLKGNVTLWSANERNADKGISAFGWYQLPEQLTEAQDAIDWDAPEIDMYFSPFTFSGFERKGKQALEAQVVYLDADSFDPRNALIHPSIILETSRDTDGNISQQAFWQLDKPYPADEVARVARKVCYYHHDEGADLSSWGKAKLLRVPGSINSKVKDGKLAHGRVSETLITDATGEVFTLAEIDAAYPDVVENENRANLNLSGIEPLKVDWGDTLPSYKSSIGKVTHDVDAILKMINAEPIPGPDGNRSELRWKLEASLIETGDLTPDEILSIVAFSKVGKQRLEEDVRGLDFLRGEIAKKLAENDAKEDLERWKEPVLEINIDSDDDWIDNDGLKHRTRKRLTTDEELNDARTNGDNFLVMWDKWARDTLGEKYNPPYMRMNAALGLSMALADCIEIPKRGNIYMPACLYFGVLGGSSTGKSEAKEFFNQFIREIGNDASKRVLHGDMHPTTFNERLWEFNGLPSTFYEDEADKLFKQVNGNTYLSGLLETMTLVYDGRVERVLRSRAVTVDEPLDNEGNPLNPDNIARMSLAMVGTPKAMLSQLNLNLVRSGFLARFCWVWGNPVKLEAKNLTPQVMGKDDPSAYTGKDQQLVDIVAQVRMARTFWKNSEGRSSSAHKPIFLSDKAAKRLDKFMSSALSVILSENMNMDVWTTVIVRMGNSILRLAALLAAFNKTLEIQEQHMIWACVEGEDWFNNTRDVLYNLHASEFQKETDAIRDFVRRQPEQMATQQQIYRAFANYRPRYIDGLLDGLLNQGRLFRNGVGNGALWSINQ
jgi:hypothetical protein